MSKLEQKSGVLGLDGDLDNSTNPFLADITMFKTQGFYDSEHLALSKRKGFQKFNPIPLVDPADASKLVTFTGVFDFTKSDYTSSIVATTTTNLYKYNTPTANIWNDVPLTNAGGSRTGTSNQLFDYVVLNDQMYLGNGKDTNIRFDGSNAWFMGITKPSTTATNAANGAGVLTGAYSYKITFVNAIGNESLPSAATNTITAATNALRLTSIPVSTDTQVTKRKIYRTTTGGGVWLLIGTINDNTTTTYDDNSGDINLTIAVDEFGNGVPAPFSMIDVFKGITFMAGDLSYPSRVYFSKNGIPSAQNSNDYRDLDINGGDRITGLCAFQNTVVVFKNNSIWNGIGEDRTNLGFEKRVTSVGAVNHWGIVEVPGKSVLVFMGNDGLFYFYDGVGVTPTAQNIYQTLQKLNRNLLSKTSGAAAIWENQIRWVVASSGSSECDLMIWYDYSLDKWGVTDLTNIKANLCTTFHDDNNKLQFAIGGVYNIVTKSGGGYVWYGDQGGSDDGVAITCEVIDRGHPKASPDSVENNKVFSHLFVWFKPTVGAILNISCYLNDPLGIPISLGTIDCSASSGQGHLHFNQKARRIYFRITETSSTQGLVLRGWRTYFKDIGQNSAP